MFSDYKISHRLKTRDLGGNDLTVRGWVVNYVNTIQCGVYGLIWRTDVCDVA